MHLIFKIFPFFILKYFVFIKFKCVSNSHFYLALLNELPLDKFPMGSLGDEGGEFREVLGLALQNRIVEVQVVLFSGMFVFI